VGAHHLKQKNQKQVVGVTISFLKIENLVSFFFINLPSMHHSRPTFQPSLFPIIELRNEDNLNEEPNPFTFQYNGNAIQFMESGGWAEEHYIHYPQDGKLYTQLTVHVSFDAHPRFKCRHAEQWMKVPWKTLTLYFEGLEFMDLNRPLLKSWEEINPVHAVCGGKIYYTVHSLYSEYYSATP
jgi:hypothetical protein